MVSSFGNHAVDVHSHLGVADVVLLVVGNSAGITCIDGIQRNLFGRYGSNNDGGGWILCGWLCSSSRGRLRRLHHFGGFVDVGDFVGVGRNVDAQLLTSLSVVLREGRAGGCQQACLNKINTNAPTYLPRALPRVLLTMPSLARPTTQQQKCESCCRGVFDRSVASVPFGRP